jgi:putative membrane protein
MNRNLFDYLIITFKGLAMGAADVVPGVSGGTIAFISGIYEELITSINNINLGLLKTLRKDGLKAAWAQLNGNFLLALIVGIGISILSLAKLIKLLLKNEPILLWSFFFGLVVASIIFIGKEIKKWDWKTILGFILAAVLAYYITTLAGSEATVDSPWFMFIAGALAICAMILPGISGAFILVLLGAYEPVLTAIDTRDIKIIAIVGIGAVIGLLLFSKLLKWLFNNFKNITFAVLTGFILGSLNKIWPWKEVLTTRVNSKGEEVPFLEKSILPNTFESLTGKESQLILAIVLMLVGFFTIFIMEKLATGKDKKHA